NGGTDGNLSVGNITNNAALVFNHSDTISTPNAISGAGSLSQNGGGVLTLSGANSFTGLVTVTTGTLQVGNGSALGVTNNGTVVSNGATLDLNHNNIALEPMTVIGAGVGGSGAIVDNSGSGSFLSPQSVAYITLSGDTVFGGTGRWDLRSANTS